MSIATLLAEFCRSAPAVKVVRAGSGTRERRMINLELLSHSMQEIKVHDNLIRVTQSARNLHRDIVACIDDSFDADCDTIPPMTDIVQQCLGDNYSILDASYAQMEFKLIEIVRDNIIANLPDRTCAGDKNTQCMYFFRLFNILTSLEYDVMKVLEVMRGALSKRINANDLLTLFEHTEGSVGDYNRLRKLLQEQKVYLKEYFKEKYEEFLNTHNCVKDEPVEEVEDEEPLDVLKEEWAEAPVENDEEDELDQEEEMMEFENVPKPQLKSKEKVNEDKVNHFGGVPHKIKPANNHAKEMHDEDAPESELDEPDEEEEEEEEVESEYEDEMPEDESPIEDEATHDDELGDKDETAYDGTQENEPVYADEENEKQEAPQNVKEDTNNGWESNTNTETTPASPSVASADSQQQQPQQQEEEQQERKATQVPTIMIKIGN